MKKTTLWIALCTALTVLVLAASPTAAQAPKTATVTTTVVKGTVLWVDGNDITVKMSTGEIKTFRVPEGRKAIIDGKELTVHELQPGTTLTATTTTTETPVTVRTKMVKSATVWHVQSNTVILKLPNGENKMYTVKADQKFMVNGKMATVDKLREGDIISVEKIVEEPTVEVATNSTVVGQAPPPAPPPAAPSPERAQANPKQTARPAATPSSEPPPPTARVETQPAPPPAETTSPLLWVGLILLLIIIAVVVYRATRKAKKA
jgi:hypothetical protein